MAEQVMKRTGSGNTDLDTGAGYLELWPQLKEFAKKHPGLMVSGELVSDLRAIDGQLVQVSVYVTITPASTGNIVDIGEVCD